MASHTKTYISRFHKVQSKSSDDLDCLNQRKGDHSTINVGPYSFPTKNSKDLRA